MTIRFECPTCGKNLKAPDSAVGQKGTCPQCKNVFAVPEPEEDLFDAEPVSQKDEWDTGDDDWDTGDDDLFGGSSEGSYSLSDAYGAPAPPPGGGGGSGGNRKPCPACGEQIVRTAKKCRYCGEIFDKSLRRKAKRGSGRSGGGDDDEMSTGDWIGAVLCPGLGCLAGLIWCIMGKGKGPMMVGVSFGFWLAWAAFWQVVQNL